MSDSFKLLWVEDDFEKISAFVLPWEKKGINVIPVLDYIEAKKLVQNKEFDVYMIDLILPYEQENIGNLSKLYGVELIEYIRNDLKINKPIFVLSVVYDEKVYEKLYNLGISEFFHKGSFSNREAYKLIIETIKK